MSNNNKLQLFLLTGALFVSGALKGETIGKSIATVNGEAIFSSEFDSNWKAIMEQHGTIAPNEKTTPTWEAENKKLLLDQMIEEKLLTQEAKRRNIKVPKRQLEEGIMQVKNRFKELQPGAKPSKEDYERPLTSSEQSEFLKELKSQNITEKEFETKIEDQLRVLRLTEEEIRMKVPSPFIEGKDKPGDDKEITPEYEKKARDLFSEVEKKFNDKNFKPSNDNDVDQMVVMLKSKLGETVRAYHILIKSSRTDDFKKRNEALNKIKSIKKQLDEGADFIELSKKYSDGPSSKNGGDLGTFSRGQMIPEIEKSAFSLPVGGISDVVETEFGYHIIHVVEKRAASKLRFDDIKVDLAGYLYQMKGKEKYDQFVSDLRKKGDVKVLTDFSKK